MSILGFHYTGPASFEDSGSFYNFNTMPTFNSTGTSDTYNGVFTETFYFKKFNGNKDIQSKPYRPVIKNISSSFDELWVRLCYKQSNFGITGAGSEILRLMTFSNGVFYKSGTLQLGVSGTYSSNIYWLTYNAAGTVTSTNLIGSITSSFLDTIKKEILLDFRIKLHPVAGFLQLYDYTTTLKYEYLGKTMESGITPTHFILDTINLNSGSNYTYDGFPLFSILADEKTFGMYVAPLFAKSEGSLQEQDVGSTYSNLLSRKLSPTINGYIGMTVSSGQTKSYTCKLQDTTDIALPSNYIIKSLKISEILDAVQSEPTPVNTSLKIKLGEGFVYDYVVDPIIPNNEPSITGKWQVRNVQLNTNPKTNAQWQPEDLTALEVGFSLTGV